MKFCYFVFFLFLLTACGSEPQQNTTTPPTKTTTEQPPTKATAPTNSAKAKFTGTGVRNIGPEKTAEQIEVEKQLKQGLFADENPMTGTWTGAFGPNKLTIIIGEAQDGKAAGHSVCAGNYRPINGSYTTKESGEVTMILEEPGDDPYDGIFTIVFPRLDQTTECSGSWKAFKSEKNSNKDFSLIAKEFVYKKDIGLWPNTSERLLSEDFVAEHHPEDLRLMRNEIYARHGYCFKNKEMRYYFEETDWYMPISTDVREVLTEIEVKNIELIYTYEEYYEENYDDFGR